MRDQDRALYIISVAAELAGVHPQTLRIYERRGLIEPQRTEGGSRRYSEREIRLLRRIQELTNAGISLEGVKVVLELEHQLERVTARVRELERELDRAYEEARDAVQRVHRQYRRDLVPVSKSMTRVRTTGGRR